MKVCVCVCACVRVCNAPPCVGLCESPIHLLEPLVWRERNLLLLLQVYADKLGPPGHTVRLGSAPTLLVTEVHVVEELGDTARHTHTGQRDRDRQTERDRQADRDTDRQIPCSRI